MPKSERAAVRTLPGEVTELLQQAGCGNQEARDRLFQLLYPVLRRLAAGKMARERPGHSLSPTALVAEAYFRIASQLGVPWKNRTHFLAFAALTMRRVLIDWAKEKAAKKREGRYERVPLHENLSLPWHSLEEAIAVHECLEKLERDNPRQAKIVELRFFGGLSNQEIAEHLGISLCTVEADWRFARAWLRLEFGGDSCA
jgi:RNA polymerase sigma factor (TIGR02999 family)